MKIAHKKQVGNLFVQKVKVVVSIVASSIQTAVSRMKLLHHNVSQALAMSVLLSTCIESFYIRAPLTAFVNANSSVSCSSDQYKTNMAKRSSKLLSTSTIAEITTEPISGMKPGTSGLRKKVEVWQGSDDENKYYVENFIQSLIDTAVQANGGEMLDT